MTTVVDHLADLKSLDAMHQDAMRSHLRDGNVDRFNDAKRASEAIAWAIGQVTQQGQPSILALPMTYEQACEVNSERTNGTVANKHNELGIPLASPSKGGRYWIDGEFTLVELKALIVIAEKQFNDEGYAFTWDHPIDVQPYSCCGQHPEDGHAPECSTRFS